MSASTTLADITEVDFPAHASDEAQLYVYEHGADLPFAVERVFVVAADEDCTRGRHAHRLCTQLLVAVKGEVTLKVDDGTNVQTFMLDNPRKGVLVPPGIWGGQEYPSGSVLMVLTDQPYDEGDYIRNYDEFIKYKGAQG